MLRVVMSIGLLAGVLASSPVVSGQESDSKVLSLSMKSLSGQDVALDKYRGKVLLIVNVASACGLTPQYEGLQQLHEKYGSKGLVVMGFPCNQFGAQEPGTAEEIRTFCSDRYGVTFEMFAKVDVNGDSACDLYRFLTSVETKPQGSGKISWNFEKFVVNREGQVVARFKPSTKPDDPQLIAALEAELANR